MGAPNLHCAYPRSAMESFRKLKHLFAPAKLASIKSYVRTWVTTV